MIAHARKVPNPATTNKYHGVLLKIVVLSRNISSYLAAIGQAHAGNFAQGRVGLLGRHSANTKANPTTLRTAHQIHGFPFRGDLAAGLSDKLIASRHNKNPKS